MPQHGLRKFLHRCRILMDVMVSGFLLLLLSIWGTRYLLAGDPIVGDIEQLFGTDKAMHLLLGFFLAVVCGLVIADLSPQQADASKLLSAGRVGLCC